MNTPLMCYSPLPPSAYSRNGIGHGLWIMHHQMPKWNMLWASFPALDLYLDPDVSLSAIISELDPKAWGYVAATANEDTLPALWESLKGPPEGFMQTLLGFNYEILPAFQFLGPEWIDTVAMRLAKESPYEIAKKLSMKFETSASSNIICTDALKWKKR